MLHLVHLSCGVSRQITKQNITLFQGPRGSETAEAIPADMLSEPKQQLKRVCSNFVQASRGALILMRCTHIALKMVEKGRMLMSITSSSILCVKLYLLYFMLLK